MKAELSLLNNLSFWSSLHPQHQTFNAAVATNDTNVLVRYLNLCPETHYIQLHSSNSNRSCKGYKK